jgi:hypothetical protein
MQNAQKAEPPSRVDRPFFMIGQDSHGNWVVQDQAGIRGGLFVDRSEALRFVRAEGGERMSSCVTVAGILELDMRRCAIRR